MVKEVRRLHGESDSNSHWVPWWRNKKKNLKPIDKRFLRNAEDCALGKQIHD